MMFKPTLAALALLLCLCAAGPATATVYMTARDLNRSCMSDAPNDTMFCLGYIAGVIDYHVMLQSLGTAPTTDFCLPDGLPVEQAAVTVLAFLRRSPQHADFIAGPAVAMALHESYPCAPPPRKKKKR